MGKVPVGSASRRSIETRGASRDFPKAGEQGAAVPVGVAVDDGTRGKRRGRQEKRRHLLYRGTNDGQEWEEWGTNVALFVRRQKNRRTSDGIRNASQRPTVDVKFIAGLQQAKRVGRKSSPRQPRCAAATCCTAKDCHRNGRAVRWKHGPVKLDPQLRILEPATSTLTNLTHDLSRAWLRLLDFLV